MNNNTTPTTTTPTNEFPFGEAFAARAAFEAATTLDELKAAGAWMARLQDTNPNGGC